MSLKGQLNEDCAESIFADVFRGNSRRSSIPPRPSLISTAGKPGFAHELATRVVVLKARGRVFDTRDALDGLGLAISSLAPQGSHGAWSVEARSRRLCVFILSLFALVDHGELGILMSSATATPCQMNAQAALTTRVARELPSGQHGCERSNVRPHLFVRLAHLQYIPGIGRSHRLPIGTLSWPLGSPNLLTSQSIVSCLAAS